MAERIPGPGRDDEDGESILAIVANVVAIVCPIPGPAGESAASANAEPAPVTIATLPSSCPTAGSSLFSRRTNPATLTPGCQIDEPVAELQSTRGS